MADAESRYRLGEILGQGGMGVVYRAFDTQMKREVALKTLLDVDNATMLDLFYKEWGLLATIVHPNIVEIYDVGEFELEGTRRPFFTMPLLRGITLDRMIRERSPRLSVENSVGILIQAARGLQAAHERGLIHRDVKPSNLFVMEDNSVKLIDFGIARLARMVTGLAPKGTIFYIAPEVYQMRPPSALSDQFGLAGVCYETLAGRRPFDGVTDQEVIQAVLQQNPPPVSELNPKVNLAMAQVIHKGLAKQPWHRFRSVREFGEALAKALRNEPLEILDSATVQPRLERVAQSLEQEDYEFASELLAELEGEGHADPKIAALRAQVDQGLHQAKIAKLLEGARRFYEAGEHAPALRKIQEALELDRGNAEALALKSRIEGGASASKVDQWVAMARESLEKLEFEQAREALEKIRRTRPHDPEASRLRAEIDEREAELYGHRVQKMKLYKAATEEWSRGDIVAAFSRLEALMALVRDQPDVAGQNEMYRRFYEQFRAERDAIHRACDEAWRLLSEDKPGAALAICRRYLDRFPSYAPFEELKRAAEAKQAQTSETEEGPAATRAPIAGGPVSPQAELAPEESALRPPGDAHQGGSAERLAPDWKRRLEAWREIPWRRWAPALALAAIFVAAVAVVSVVTARGRRRAAGPTGPARVVSLSAHPAGATILLNGEPCGVTQCEPRLTPGSYRAEAKLAGYQPAAVEFTVEASGANPVFLALSPLGTVVRVASDLEGAAVLLDDAPAGQIQGGELEIRDLPAGLHTLSVHGPAGRGTVTFEVGPAMLPVVRQPLEAAGLRTVVAAGMGPAARLWTNVRGAEALVDGQPAGAVGPEGLALSDLAAGPHELAVKGAGGIEHKLAFSSEAAPVVAAFLGSDRSLGSLRITVNEDDAAVFLNGQRQRRTTQKGGLLLNLTPGQYRIRVAKEGFQPTPERAVEVKPGEETRLEFQLARIPRFAGFQVRNGTPGAEVVLDGTLVGTIGADGTFAFAKLDPPGRHTVLVRKEGHKPRQVEMDFPAGATVELDGSLESLLGTLVLEVSPREAQVSLVREGEPSGRAVEGTTMQVAEGTYRVTARASGYQPGATTVRVTAGRSTVAALSLKRAEPPKPEVRQPSMTLADWEKTEGWTRDGPLLVRRGGDVVTAPAPPAPGTYLFTVVLQRGSRLEWLVNYQNERNYVHYQIDRSNFTRMEVANGRRSEPVRTPHRLDREAGVSVQIDVTSEAIIHRVLRDGHWQFLDEFRKPGLNMTAGRFAFRLGGRDQIALSEFRFTPR